MKGYTLGIDLGSSSIKLSLLDIATGTAAATATKPSEEMHIDSSEAGFAEQDPQMWWGYIVEGIKELSARFDISDIRAIGISYQMHGLVCLDSAGEPLRKAIIWCDSRAVEIGREANAALGKEFCLEHLLNSPGNFTASKLAWVKRNEPAIFERIAHFMLPGDYIAYRLSGTPQTTFGGLSEQILWDFSEERCADYVAKYYDIPLSLIPEQHPAIGIQAYTTAAIERELGIKEHTPISYRAGDQPNNAFSLNVMQTGEIAATAGTSGVVYGVSSLPKADSESRVNTFLHVNHSAADPHYGVLLCINGTGILNSWMRRQVAPELSYDEINRIAATAPCGSDGLTIVPFGNGAERVLGDRLTGASIEGIDFNRHTQAHLLRAAQEGIAYSFNYGVEIMRTLGIEPRVIRAGKANMMLSPLFRQTLATLTGARIELFDTDGALGAARGAALGAGIYTSREECFGELRLLEVVEPCDEWREKLTEGYKRWKKIVENKINEK